MCLNCSLYTWKKIGLVHLEMCALPQRSLSYVNRECPCGHEQFGLQKNSMHRWMDTKGVITNGSGFLLIINICISRAEMSWSGLFTCSGFSRSKVWIWRTDPVRSASCAKPYAFIAKVMLIANATQFIIYGCWPINNPRDPMTDNKGSSRGIWLWFLAYTGL